MLRDTVSSGKGKVLAIVTSQDLLGDTGYRTGYWMAELAYPYLALLRAGCDIDLASPRAETPPWIPTAIQVSPTSQTVDTLACTGLLANEAHRGKLENTLKLSRIRREDYVGVWLVWATGRR